MNEDELRRRVREIIKRKQEEDEIIRRTIEIGTEAYIEAGLTPDPNQLGPEEQKIFWEEFEKLPEHVHLSQLWEIFNRARKKPPDENQQPEIDRIQHAEKPPETQTPRLEMQIKATATHYGIQTKGITQNRAADFMNTTDTTYRKYRDNDWLLTKEEFEQQTGVTIAQYWDEYCGS